MPILSRIEEESDLTVVEFTDPWTVDDYKAAYPPVGNLTKYMLCDFSRSQNLHWLDRSVFEEVSAYQGAYDQGRVGGASAYVLPDEGSVLLFNLYISITEVSPDRLSGIARKIFRDVEEARNWLSDQVAKNRLAGFDDHATKICG